MNGESIAYKAYSVTYCVGVMLDKGMIFASDSRTNAGVDNFAKFCKMTVFERRGDRVVVLLSSGNLAVLPTSKNQSNVFQNALLRFLAIGS